MTTTDDDMLIDLGSARTETRGNGLGKRDDTSERNPMFGIQED